MTGKFACRFCLAPIEPCPDGDGCRGARTATAAYCYGWVHQDTRAHLGHPDNPHSAQPVVA